MEETLFYIDSKRFDRYGNKTSGSSFGDAKQAEKEIFQFEVENENEEVEMKKREILLQLANEEAKGGPWILPRVDSVGPTVFFR